MSLYPIRVRDDQWVDQEGRQVILHGINMVNKEKTCNYLGAWDDDDFELLRQWGFNVVRLGIIWDGIEPEPGKYDEAYLDGVEKLIHAAEKHGIWVFLDMHQDLYGGEYSDGAPRWAMITDDEPHLTGEVWSDSYLISPAVHRAFDHFWSNAPAPDGIGLQDHYAAAWRHVAKRFAGHPAVIGYDLMNEPFIGSEVTRIQPLMYMKYAELAAAARGIPNPDIESMIADFFDPVKRMDVLQFMSDPDRYASIIDVVTEDYSRFEREMLSAFFSKVTQAIRQVDPDTAVFLETNYFSNLGVLSGIEPAVGVDGELDMYQVYAPHGYDLVTDTPHSDEANPARLKLIFKRHELTRKRLNMPMMIGEWGAYYGSAGAKDTACDVKDIFEQLLCGDTYWSYENRHMDRYSYFPAICRAYPMAVTGQLKQYRHCSDTGSFTMSWAEDSRLETDAPTVIYVPNIELIESGVITLTPEGALYTMERINGCAAGYVIVPPAGSAAEAVDRWIRISRIGSELHTDE
ncbi:cellulase family glycosylhydrolase [Paenibacillus marinisediminis]